MVVASSDPPPALTAKAIGRFAMGMLLLIVLVILLLGSVPAYPYSRRWGYGPSGVLGLLLVVLLVRHKS